MNESPVEPAIAKATQRIAMVAALKQIRRIVDEEMALDKQRGKWTRIVVAITIVCTIVTVYWVTHQFLR